MAARPASAGLRDLPEPWWSASPFQTGPIPVPAPRPRQPKRREQPRTRPAKTKEFRHSRVGKGGHATAAKPVVVPAPQSRPAPRHVVVRVAQPRVRIYRRSRYRLRFPLFFGVLALACLVLAPLALNVAAYQAEWRVSRLEQTKQRLLEEQGHLNARVAALRSPDHVLRMAEGLGMVLVRPGFLVISGQGPVADMGAGSEKSLP